MGGFWTDVLVAIIALIAIAVLLGLLGGSVYDRIGAGGMAVEDRDPDLVEGAGLPRGEVRDLEIEQMLTARSERLARMGEQPLDVEAELTRLRAGGEVAWSGSSGQDRDPEQHRGEAHSHDPELVRELHQLVIARNERRLRRGEQPLDVQAEVQRRLAELDD